jgi:hypothetical protein
LAKSWSKLDKNRSRVKPGKMNLKIQLWSLCRGQRYSQL